MSQLLGRHGSADRGGEDDGAAPALRDHLPRHGLADEERPLEVDVEHAIPELLGDLQEWLAPQHARVAHENVHAPEGGDDLPHHRLDLGGVGHVALHGERPPSQLLDFARHALRLGGVLLVDHRHVGALAGETERNRPPYGAATARDDRLLTF